MSLGLSEMTQNQHELSGMKSLPGADPFDMHAAAQALEEYANGVHTQEPFLDVNWCKPQL